MKRKVIVVFALFFSAVSCQKNEGGKSKKLSSKDTEIDFADLLSETPELTILTYLHYYKGAGLITKDFNNETHLFLVKNQ